MNESEIRIAVFCGIASVLDVYPEAVEAESKEVSMSDELDSLDAVELAMLVESQLSIELKDSEIKLEWTPEEFVQYIFKTYQ